uniref:Putative cytochrome P450 n=1 Tax=Eschscholzia californica subsp. californica TaxID=222997 RepID=A0A2Z6BXW5_ESCCA|nr:putative cytochrome P450 [Eschscholzia californica subsp. californica]
MDTASSISLLLPWAVVVPSIATLLALLLFLFITSPKTPKRKTSSKPPPTVLPGAWPILGHLHLFKEGESPHHMLKNLADKYGPAFVMKFGQHRSLVVSNTKIVKECFTTNDTLFSNRPSTTAFDLMTYAHDSVAFTPYSPYWRELRKISTLKLLSNNRLKAIKKLRGEEVDVCFRGLYGLWKNKTKNGAPVLVDMKKWFEEVANNVVIRVIVGKLSFGTKIVDGKEEAVEYKTVMDELLRLASLSLLSDMAPILGWLDFFQGSVRKMKQTGKRLDVLLEKWLGEHREKKNLVGEDEQDFMDVMLSIVEESKLSGHEADAVIKATCLAMIMGGTDTTAVTLTWIISLLMNNRHALEKAREELETHVGKDRQVEDTDLQNLVYLSAIVKETMRLYPLGTLLERETKEDCEIGGFHIQGGTRLLVNIWMVQRDPAVWNDPSTFKPERFLTDKSEIDVGGQHFELIPFGAGRRVCPAVSFALQFLHLVLARLIHGYDLGTSNNVEVDLTESPEGHVNHKASPLELLLTPRLNPELY